MAFSSSNGPAARNLAHARADIPDIPIFRPIFPIFRGRYSGGDIHIPGTHALIPLAFRFRTAFLRLQYTPQHLLQTLNEFLVAQRPTRAAVPAQVPEFLFRYGTVEERVPIRDDRQKRSNLHQTIVTSRQVRVGAAHGHWLGLATSRARTGLSST